MQHVMGWEQHSQQVAEQQIPAAQQPQPPPPQLQQQQAAASQQDNPFREYPLPYEQQPVQRVCRRVSVRVVLQRLPAAPPPDEEQRRQHGAGSEAAGAAGSGWQQRGLLGAGQPWQQAYTCTLEYPAFTLKVRQPPVKSGLPSRKHVRSQPSGQQRAMCFGVPVHHKSSWCAAVLGRCLHTPSNCFCCCVHTPHNCVCLQSSDYLVAADVFDSGLASWQALRKGDAFWMPWDGTPYRWVPAGSGRALFVQQWQGQQWQGLTYTRPYCQAVHCNTNRRSVAVSAHSALGHFVPCASGASRPFSTAVQALYPLWPAKPCHDCREAAVAK